MRISFVSQRLRSSTAPLGCALLFVFLTPSLLDTVFGKSVGEKVSDPFVVPVRAVVLGVEGKTLNVGPGADGGMKVGMEFRIFRGSNPKGTSQWVGKAKAVNVGKRGATLELTEGEAHVTDYAISDPIDLGQTIVMPKADRTTRPVPPLLSARSVEVKLYANVENPGREIVSFGVPFPPNAIKDDSEVAVFQGDKELPVATKVLAPWRIDAKEGSPRSVLVQFPIDFGGKAEQVVTARWDRPRTQRLDQLTPVKDLLVFKTIESTTQYEGQKKSAPVTLRYEEPRVLAVLPASWLCESWIVGPQIPASDDKWLPDFEQQWQTLFEPQTKSTLSSNYAEQQLDRTITYYKVYARTGQQRAALESYRIATFYRNCIYTAEQTKRGRGALSLKHSLESANGKGWMDIKYAYAEGLAAHYLLTGDERCLGTIDDICAFFDSDFGAFIRNNYSKKPRGWTERFAAFTLLSKLHAYQVTGRAQYLEDAKQQIANVRDMQLSPPDQKNDRSPALRLHSDGSWRHSSDHHGDGEGFGSSIWMSTYLIDGIFQYWLLTGDERCPDMLANYAEFAERYGINWFSWADQTTAEKGPPRWPQPWYWASSTHGGYIENGDEADHNIETGYLFLMGYYFRADPRYLAIGTQLIQRKTTRMHPRQFNWVYRASPQAIWFLRASAVQPEDLTRFSRGQMK